MRRVLCAVLSAPLFAMSQQDTTGPNLSFDGFVDAFYVYDFAEPEGQRQSFLYNHNRHNEVNVNLGLLKVTLKHKKYRGSFGLHAGTYVNDNYAAEPVSLKFINEGNGGIALNKKATVWLDAGIFGSHIGFESAISKDNWTLTRSINAENSPYYLAGAKVTWYPTTRWELALWMCNGWQRIQRVQGNSLPGYCTHIKYTGSNDAVFNWSTFTGTEDPDATRRIRSFSNMYVQLPLSEKVGLIAAFDIGVQQKEKHSSELYSWFSPIIKVRYKFSDQWSSTLRMEYFHDPSRVIIGTGTAGGFKTGGVSINLDYAPEPNVVFRIEPRWLTSEDKIFATKKGAVNDNFFIATSVAVSF
jgi:hypothetical protein